jgi:hypothetical protein
VVTAQSLQHAPAYNGGLQEIRVDDPERRPRSYTALIGPAQLVAFARDIDSGVPCDARGGRAADPAATTCLLFDGLAEARAFCEAAVLAAPAMRFDVFDAHGRVHPPLLTIVHPSRARSLDTNPAALHRRRIAAWVLIAGAVPVIAYAYFIARDVGVLLPGLVGINMILAGGRLLWFNLGIRETERARQERLDRLEPS